MNKNGLTDYISKINKLTNSFTNDTNEKIKNAIGLEGVKLVETEYADVKNIISYYKIDNNSIKIISQDIGEKPKIAYLEYGTGLLGIGTYEGHLPDTVITFQSKGGTYTTLGWEYYYDNPYTKRNGGWYYGGQFTKGQIAGNYMWNVAQELHKQLTNIALNIIKGE